MESRTSYWEQVGKQGQSTYRNYNNGTPTGQLDALTRITSPIKLPLLRRWTWFHSVDSLIRGSQTGQLYNALTRIPQQIKFAPYAQVDVVHRVWLSDWRTLQLGCLISWQEYQQIKLPILCRWMWFHSGISLSGGHSSWAAGCPDKNTTANNHKDCAILSHTQGGF
jgi:hypothetical protein